MLCVSRIQMYCVLLKKKGPVDDSPLPDLKRGVPTLRVEMMV